MITTHLVPAVKSLSSFDKRSLLALLCFLVLSCGIATRVRAQLGENYNLELIGRLPFNSELSDLWGYVDETGREYAIVGRQDGVSIIDVTNPASPQSVFTTPGLVTQWRDVKTWGDYAYVTCECPSGMQIIDLSPLPSSTSLTYSYWQDDSIAFQGAHNLFIDDKGYAYLFGINLLKGGAAILDLNEDPMDPKVVGIYDQNYLHDGVVRNDTLWGAAVLKGDAQAIDVTDKSDPQLVSSWKTPGAFTHNIWFSDDGDYVFTTDEIKGGSITAYDVSNPLNPTRIDQWTPPDTGIIPHNTHFFNDYLITSHYTIGLNIIDVKRPNNMLEVGRYDTSPDYDYQGFHGCWGVYPWLPSGNIIATDIEEGLFIFDATFDRGCYLEGRVVDEQSGGPVFFPTIEIQGQSQLSGNIVGKYTYANKAPGIYTVTVSADDYYSKTFEDVSLTKGEVTYLNVALSKWPTGISEQIAQIDDKLLIYPNPTHDVITIKSEQPIDRVTLHTIQGQLIPIYLKTTLDEQYSIDVSHIEKGIYTLGIDTSGRVVYRIVTIL